MHDARRQNRRSYSESGAAASGRDLLSERALVLVESLLLLRVHACVPAVHARKTHSFERGEYKHARKFSASSRAYETEDGAAARTTSRRTRAKCQVAVDETWRLFGAHTVELKKIGVGLGQ